MKTMEPVAPELGFRFQHGPLARDLAEFRDVLSTAPSSVVFYHREHFAPWLRDVLREVALARRFEGYHSTPPAPDVYREIALELVARRLAEGQGRPGPVSR